MFKNVSSLIRVGTMNFRNTLSEQKKGVAALIFLALVFATMGIYVRYLHADFLLYQQVYLRVFGAALIGGIVFFSSVNFRKFFTLSHRDGAVVVFRALTYGLAVVCLTLAYLTMKYSNASFITALPVVPFLGWLLLKEKFSLHKLLYVLCGLFGVGLISLHGVDGILSGGSGVIYGLISALSFGLSYIARKWQSDTLNDKESAILILLIEGIAVLVASFFAGESVPLASAFSVQAIGVIAIASIANIACLVLINYGFVRVSASVAGNMLMLEPFFAVLFSIFLYQEIPVARELVGGGLIVYSAYAINRLKP